MRPKAFLSIASSLLLSLCLGTSAQAAELSDMSESVTVQASVVTASDSDTQLLAKRYSRKPRSKKKRKKRSKKKDTAENQVEEARLIWEVRVDGRAQSTPVLDDDNLYFTTSHGTLYTFDKYRGQLKWQRRLSDLISTREDLNYDNSYPTIAGDTILVGTSAGYMMAINKYNGSLSWFFKTGRAIASAPVVFEDKVFFSCRDGKVYALELQKGKPLWAFDTQNLVDAPPSVDFDSNQLYIGDYSGRTYALDMETGKSNWTYSLFGSVISKAKYTNDTVYFTTTGGSIFALDKSNGFKKWSYTARDSQGIYGSAIVMETQVCAGDMAGNLSCVEPYMGTRLWAKHFDGAIMSTPTLFNNHFYVSTGNGKLSALTTDGSALVWSLDAKSVMDAPIIIEENRIYTGSNNGRIMVIEAIEDEKARKRKKRR